MDKYIDSRFERVEKALTNLIDSITKYHPSTAQATELVAADSELTKGLGEVERHQSNHLRLQQLRADAEANDASIRDTFRTLANARRDLKTTPATVFPDGPDYPVQYGDLLAFARRISKTTMPPPGVTNGVALNGGGAGADGQAGDLTNANGTPALGSTAQTPVASQVQSPAAGMGIGAGGASLGSQPPSELPTQATLASTAATSLPENLSQHLNPLMGAQFFPWPAEDKIRLGSLASLQHLQEQGIDPKGYDPVEEERRRIKAEEERREREERERIEREEEERRMREEREKRRAEVERQREREQLESFRRGSVATGMGAAGPGDVPRSSTAGPGERRQFQFISLEDEDDDDENE